MGKHRADVQVLDAPTPQTTLPGRRIADRPTDSLTDVYAASDATTYVGRRVARVPVPQQCATPQAEDATELTGSGVDVPVLPRLDTGAIERVLAELEPVDQTTSFEHEPTTKLPMLRAEPPPPGGKRRAVKHAGRRGPLFKALPSAPVLVGIAALAVSVTGVVATDQGGLVSNDNPVLTAPASALNGSSGTGKVGGRGDEVSRDGAREAQANAAGEPLQDAAEGLVEQRNAALQDLAADAEQQAKLIAKNLWQYPLASVSVTAGFGEYGLWSSYHTGTDFNGNTGDAIYAIANGTVTSASYDGAYGNKTVVTLEDGTEIWYCHQNSIGVSVGDFVRGGEVIGTVGATGHVTGSHLHIEVRPGGGDPVDPYAAMQQHGLF